MNLGKIPDLGRISDRVDRKAGHTFPDRFPHEPDTGQLVQSANRVTLGR